MQNYEAMLVIILGNLNIYVVKQRHFDYYFYDPQPVMSHFIMSYTLKNPVDVGEIVSLP